MDGFAEALVARSTELVMFPSLPDEVEYVVGGMGALEFREFWEKMPWDMITSPTVSEMSKKNSAERHKRYRNR